MEVQYDKLKLYINSGIISHIFTQICESFSDFYGILLGKRQITNDIVINDVYSSHKIKNLYINIDNVIFIHDKFYIKENLDGLIGKIKSKYEDRSIIGNILFNCMYYVCTFILLF